MARKKQGTLGTVKLSENVKLLAQRLGCILHPVARESKDGGYELGITVYGPPDIYAGGQGTGTSFDEPIRRDPLDPLDLERQRPLCHGEEEIRAALHRYQEDMLLHALGIFWEDLWHNILAGIPLWQAYWQTFPYEHDRGLVLCDWLEEELKEVELAGHLRQRVERLIGE